MASAVVHAQDAARWLPRLRPFEPLITAPRETQFRGALVLAERPDGLDYDGRHIEAEVVIGNSLSILPYALAFAAGAMMYVVIEELIQESQSGLHSDYATVGALVGFAVMMVIDAALG